MAKERKGNLQEENLDKTLKTNPETKETREEKMERIQRRQDAIINRMNEEKMKEERMNQDDTAYKRLMRCETLVDEEEYRYAIGEFLNRVSLKEFCEAIGERVIGQENLEKVCYNVYHYLELVSRGNKKNLPFILAAPSGCGKSETYRAIKEYLKKNMRFLPCEYVDSSALTETGFRGDDPVIIVKGLLQRYESNGIGIVFLDEMDKKIIPSYTSNGSNVNAAVQHGMLTLLEGRQVSIKGINGSVDTGNTLFIAMGAFDFLRNEKDEETSITIGEKKKKREHFSDITREEMLEAGAINEFVGRFSSIVNYHKLNEEAIRKIIDLNVRDMENEFMVKIDVDESVYNAVFKVSNGKFGCRTIKHLLRARVEAIDMKVKLSEVKDTIGLSRSSIVINLNENGDTWEKVWDLPF